MPAVGDDKKYDVDEGDDDDDDDCDDGGNDDRDSGAGPVKVKKAQHQKNFLESMLTALGQV